MTVIGTDGRRMRKKKRNSFTMSSRLNQTRVLGCLVRAMNIQIKSNGKEKRKKLLKKPTNSWWISENWILWLFTSSRDRSRLWPEKYIQITLNQKVVAFQCPTATLRCSGETKRCVMSSSISSAGGGSFRFSPRFSSTGSFHLWWRQVDMHLNALPNYGNGQSRPTRMSLWSRNDFFPSSFFSLV